MQKYECHLETTFGAMLKLVNTHTHKKEMHIILFTLLVGLDLDARVEEVDKITIQPSIIVL
jgi:hypothetical protein